MWYLQEFDSNKGLYRTIKIFPNFHEATHALQRYTDLYSEKYRVVGE